MATGLELKEAGFSDTEISEYMNTQRSNLLNAGFTEEEINERFPVIAVQPKVPDGIDAEKVRRATINAGTLGIPVSSAYKNHDMIEEGMKINEDKVDTEVMLNRPMFEGSVVGGDVKPYVESPTVSARGVLKEFKRLPLNLSAGLTRGYASLLLGFASIADVMDMSAQQYASWLTGEEIQAEQEVKSYLTRFSEELREQADMLQEGAIVVEPREKRFTDKLTQGLASAPFGILEFELGVPFAGLTALGESEGNLGIVAKAVFDRYLWGRILRGSSKAPRVVRVPAIGTVAGTQTAIEGGDVENFSESAIVMGVLSGIGGRGMNYRQWRGKPYSEKIKAISIKEGKSEQQIEKEIDKDIEKIEQQGKELLTEQKEIIRRTEGEKAKETIAGIEAKEKALEIKEKDIISKRVDKELVDIMLEKPKPIEVKPKVPEVKPKRIISEEAYQKALDALGETKLRAFPEPADFKNLVTVGAFHIETGVRKFNDWSKTMIERFGEKVEPQLQKIWDEAHKLLGVVPKKEEVVKPVKIISKEVRGQIKDARVHDEIKRTSVVNFVTENLPVALRGQFLRATSKARTPAVLEKLFDRIDKEINEFNELREASKKAGAVKSKIAFIKKIGELNQTVVNEVKRDAGIDKPINKMSEAELNTILSGLKERFKFKRERGLQIKGKETQKPDISEKIYEDNRILQGEKKSKFVESLKDIKKDVGRIAEELLAPISTRLKIIDPSLKRAIRQFEFKLMNHNQKDLKVAVPYLDKVKKMPKEDFVDLDLALKNGDTKKITELTKKYDLEKEYADVKKMLDDIYDRANAVGFDIGYTKNYYPRMIEDAEGFLQHLGRRDDFSVLEEAIKRKEFALGRYLEVEEKAYLINTMLRGYKGGNITLSETGAMKNRVIDFVDAELNQFYRDSNQSLSIYIKQTNDAIEARRFFGKEQVVDKKVDQFNNIDDSVGAYTAKLLAEEKITVAQEKELKSILNARFGEVGASGIVGLYKNLAYIDVMGSPFNAVTQIGDMAFALYAGGVKRAIPEALKSLVGKSLIKKEDIGLMAREIATEVSDTSKSARLVDTVFRAVGLLKIDTIGKEALINSSIRKYQDMARKNEMDAKFIRDLKEVFGDEYQEVIADLKSGVITENVKYLAFNELLDVQPVALSEVPAKYLTGGNGRIFYMLKTWTLKMFDVYRNEVFMRMREDKAEGINNFIRLTAALMLMNATADEIKDFMLGRKTDFSDRVVDNILKLLGFSRYTQFQVQRDGLGSTLLEQILPPAQTIDDVSKDTIKLFKDFDENLAVDKLRTVQDIPIGGKLYYWWFGKGSELKKRGRGAGGRQTRGRQRRQRERRER